MLVREPALASSQHAKYRQLERQFRQLLVAFVAVLLLLVFTSILVPVVWPNLSTGMYLPSSAAEEVLLSPTSTKAWTELLGVKLQQIAPEHIAPRISGDDSSAHTERLKLLAAVATTATKSPTTTTATTQTTTTEDVEDYMRAWSNVTSTGFASRRAFYSGLRNQVMVFTMFIIEVMEQGHDQIVLQRLLHKDTLGTEQAIPHQFLFDVKYWNSFYPKLPRIVWCDPVIHPHLNCDTGGWNRNVTAYSKPFQFMTQQHHLMGKYFRYSTGKINITETFPHPVDKMILQGALRPSPALQKVIDQAWTKAMPKSSSKNKKPEYMTLHARIEPDMQRHTSCADKKVLYLKDILSDLERAFPVPPVPHLFIATNRLILESEGKVSPAVLRKEKNRKSKNATAEVEVNWIAVDNLKTLNDAQQHGLWNGTVSVIEFGVNCLKGTEYEKFSSTSGALVDFWVAPRGVIFVGTEVSSFSQQIMSSRFLAGDEENYKYTPKGIEKWVDEKRTDRPPGFDC